MCNNTNKSWCETGPGRIKLNKSWCETGPGRIKLISPGVKLVQVE